MAQSKAVEWKSAMNTEVSLTNHARRRMSGRGIRPEDIDMVLSFGRITHTRGAVIHVVGQKEILEHGRFLERCEGIHVLCAPNDGAVITTYRNQDLRGLRPVHSR